MLSDIKQAFLDMGMRKKDQGFLRFLWWNDPFSKIPQIVTYRFLRVVAGLICSTFLLNATMRYHAHKYIKYSAEFVNKLLSDLYIDDSTNGFHDVQSAYQFHLKVKQMMNDAAFTLCKWSSNSNDLIHMIKYDPSTTTNESSILKVLGISWNRLQDELNFDFKDIVREAYQTNLLNEIFYQ